MAAVTCQDVREWFSARVDEALSADERARLDAHLATCAECEREWARFERTIGLLRAVEPARAPGGFVDRVLAARPRPWYRRLARGLFVPWPVKLPLEIAAVVLVGGLAIMLVQRSPELQLAAPAPPPSSAVTPPTEPERERSVRSAPEPDRPSATPPTRAPAQHRPTAPPADGRRESTAMHDAAPPLGGPRVAAEAPGAVAERPPATTRPSPATEGPDGSPPHVPASRDKRAQAPAKAEQKDAGESRAPDAAASRAAERQDSGPARQDAAPPATPTPALRKSGEVRLSALDADVHARLAVADRAAAERAVRDLLVRTGGQVVSRADDGPATVLTLTLPATSWDDVRRGLQTLGTLRLEGPSGDRSGLLRVTLRLDP
jgi:anti-sigma factor RsiW